ncbi:hypothetical protein B0T09DRAFT_319342 [Sordaria sp. MPI-SDFR-AT-0083]|nr:hypothetical protein B0T09DRAFT_319342 [Sordaria sp. MPI-SDFR-AT-0083]
MPDIARSKEPYPLDKLAKIDTDKLLRVVTCPPEWYLKNVLSTTEEAVGGLRRSCSLELGVEGVDVLKEESKGIEKLVENQDLDAGVDMKAAEAASQDQPPTRAVTASAPLRALSQGLRAFHYRHALGSKTLLQPVMNHGVLDERRAIRC